MEWNDYEDNYKKEALKKQISDSKIASSLEYAKNLFMQDLPIIYSITHLAKMMGIEETYIYKISNSQRSGYRRFTIPKKNGKYRVIHEPLPNLRMLQEWILEEILTKCPVHVYAKAYKKGVSIKENVKFHRGQDIVVKLDVKDFFPNIKEKRVISLFLQLGYRKNVAVILGKIITLNNGLPQGAPTSPILSNIIMYSFDEVISNYSKKHNIRYTRYADDLTFSGSYKDFNIGHLYLEVKKELAKLNMRINSNKTSIMRRHNRQLVTGITVNEKLKVNKKYRNSIRQEVYYIEKFGIDEHLKSLGITIDSKTYLYSLIGKVKYCLFIDSKDREMEEYLEILERIYTEVRNK